MSGSIYIATTEGVKKGLIKIGMTTGDPFERIKQWSSDTGSPGVGLPLYIAYIDCDPQPLEARIHQALKQQRSRGEWFSVDLKTAVQTIYEKAASNIVKEWTTDSFRQTLSEFSDRYKTQLAKKQTKIDQCVHILSAAVLAEEQDLAWMFYEMDMHREMEKDSVLTKLKWRSLDADVAAIPGSKISFWQGMSNQESREAKRDAARKERARAEATFSRRRGFMTRSEFEVGYNVSYNEAARLRLSREYVEERQYWPKFLDELIADPSSVFEQRRGMCSIAREVAASNEIDCEFWRRTDREVTNHHD